MIRYYEKDDGSQELVTKLGVIKEKLKPTLDSCREIIRENQDRKKPLNLNLQFRVKMRLKTILQQDRPISNSEAKEITADELYSIYCDYCELIAFLNEEIGAYTPSKAEFCSFAEITIEAYQTMLHDAKIDLKEVVQNIESELISDTMASAENGVTQEKSTMSRVTARGQVGHNVSMTSPFDTVADVLSTQKTLDDYKRQLELAEAQFSKKLPGKSEGAK